MRPYYNINRYLLTMIITYGYLKYFFAYDEPEYELRTFEDKNEVTLPPHLVGNELFNLNVPKDSSGKEVFADRKYKPIIVEGRIANYSELYNYQIKTAHACDYKSLWKDPNTKPKCSMDLLREYYRVCGFFLDVGKWDGVDSGYPEAQFIPEFCELPSGKSVEESMVNSIGKTATKKILVLGDSNSHKYYLSLLETMFNHTKLDYKCELIKIEPEGNHADVTYYTNGTAFKPEQIMIQARTCTTCNSQMNICRLPPSSPYYHKLPREVVMEYLSMTLVTLDAITFNLHGKQNSEPITQQEFLLKYYLKDRYPDLLIIGATFTHDKRKPFTFVQKCMEHFIRVIDENVPPSTRVLWFDAAAHNNIPYNRCPIVFNVRIFDEEYELRGNPKLEMLNHLMFYVLKDKLLDKKSNHYGMLDLYGPSDLVMKEWAADCVHFYTHWYKTYIAYMFGLLATVT